MSIEKNEEKTQKQIKVLLVVVILVLVIGFFGYPEYQKYITRRAIEARIHSQEFAEKTQLVTEIAILEIDLNESGYMDDWEVMQEKSLWELQDIKQELDWKEEYNKLCKLHEVNGTECPSWGTYLLNKAFSE